MNKVVPLTLCLALPLSAADVEQERLNTLQTSHPKLLETFHTLDLALQHNLAKSNGPVWSLLLQSGEQLWQDATNQIVQSDSFDDRPLYWARLRLEKQLADYAAANSWRDEKYASHWQLLEETSRGRTDIQFAEDVDKRILLTGFDPFFLDRHIDQSNPSGVVAMLLDGKVIEYQGVRAQIETVLVPVRFADFDQGSIEALLEPVMASGEIDMVVTVSMGRDAFDLEHFPAKNRSARAPDNLNVFTGASKTNPLPPLLNEQPIDGPEFVGFSLPYQAMMQAEGAFAINDNRSLKTVSGKQQADSLEELAGEISVSGSGGGYLSNEISYRSILLRNRVAPQLSVGHIHTPRIAAFEPETNRKIVEQVTEMLRLALPQI